MAVSAFGASISVGGSALAEVVSIGIPARQAGVLDVTTHDSVGRYREFIRELRDTGEFTVSLMYTPGDATDDACIAAVDADDPVAIVITVKVSEDPGDTETLSFNAFGTSFEPGDLEIDSAQSATLTLKPTGPITQVPTP